MKTLIPYLLLVVFIMSCEKDPQTVSQFIANCKLENKNSAWFTIGDTSIFTMERTEEDSYSADHSLMIGRTNLFGDEGEFACWGQSIAKNLPIGKDLKLNVWIKGVDIAGKGISLVVRTDNEYTTLQFQTTQYVTTISGSFDWTEYSLDFPAVDPESQMLWVFLVFLDGTTGRVYFDDITLSEKAPL